MTTHFFAALDASTNEVRFVGDVAQGRAANCICPACRSPLIAKQGQLNVWHFAHSAGQERPECYPGAVNLMRRIAIEVLMDSEITLPSCRVEVRAGSGVSVVRDVVQWTPGLTAGIEWHPDAPKLSPIARLSTIDGTNVGLWVDLDKPPDVQLAEVVEGDGAMTFHFLLPSIAQMRTRALAESYIRRNGQFIWLKAPCNVPAIEAARAIVLSKAAAKERQRQDAGKLRANQAGIRWARIRREGLAMATGGDGAVAHVPQPPAAALSDDPMIPDRQPGCVLTFYRLGDGTTWLRYRRKDGIHVLRPWPDGKSGWQSALPRTFGHFDAELNAYRMDNFLKNMDAIAAAAVEVRSGHDLTQVATGKG